MELIELRDDHTRVWEIVREVETTHPDGSTTVDTVKSQIHEKGSGLCYRDATGGWQPSVIEWEETASGFQITRAGYVATKGLLSHDPFQYDVSGMSLRFGPSELILYDGQWQQVVAQIVPDILGKIDNSDPRKLRFDNAFGEGIHLEFEAERNGVDQNIIFDRRVELPEEMDPAASYLYTATELNLDEAVSAHAVEVTMAGEKLPVGSGALFTEPTQSLDIVFSEISGKELSRLVDSKVCDSAGATLIAEKQLARIPDTGRTYLFERIPYWFLAQTDHYPVKWDWHQKSGAMTDDETWCPRYTYYLSSGLTLDSGAILTINPGTVVKLVGASTYIQMNGKLIARGEPYNHVIFTSAYDDDCGEDLDGSGKPLSEGDPQEGDYYGAFILGNSQTAIEESQIAYCKFAYALCAGGTNYTTYEMGYDIRDCIFRDCTYGLIIIASTNAGSPAAVRNNLFVNGGTAVTIWVANNWGIYNNTFDGLGKESDVGVWFLSSASNVHIKYNIFTNIDDPVDGEPQTIEHNAYYPSVEDDPEDTDPVQLSDRPYESYSGLGDHYLNNVEEQGAACRSGAWTAKPEDVGLDDKVYTVNKPDEVSGDITDAQTWEMIPNATAEDPVALGYHHNRVDRDLTADVTVAGAGVLTLDSGLVVCVGDGSSYRRINVRDRGRIICDGDPEGDGYNVMTTRPTSSMYVKSKTYDSSYGGTLTLYNNADPDCRVRDTHFLWKTRLYVYGRLRVPVESNRFECTYYGLLQTASGVIRNNLFYVCSYGGYVYPSSGSAALLANNTFDHCNRGLWCRGSGCRITARDCLFTKCDYGVADTLSTGASLKEFNNAFWKNGTNIYKSGASQDPHNWDTELNLDQPPYDRAPGNYSDGPQENEYSWFLDQTSAWKITDKGSYWAEIAAHGDHFFSTRKTIAQRDTGEVDIGWHSWYADRDHDGMPDLWEDYYGLDPDDDSDAGADADTDGLTNLQEFRAGSNPNAEDSDGDDKNDGTEVGDEDCKSLVGWGPAQHEKFLAGPWLNNLKTNGVTIAWMTESQPGTQQVWIRGEDSSDFANSQANITTEEFGTVGHVSEAKITGLSAGAWYQYYIVSDSTTSMKFLFRTIPSSDEPFKFIVYGDTRGETSQEINEDYPGYNDGGINEYHRPVVDSILEECDDVRFIVHTGDFILNGGTEQHWIDHFFSAAGPMLAYYPLYPIVGNHEYNGDANLTNYKMLFDYQDEATKTWYYVDYSNCRLIVLDTGPPPPPPYSVPDTSTQHKDAIYDQSYGTGWLHDSQKTWNLVFAHVPPYADQKWNDGSALRGSNNLVGGLRDQDADALFSGHSHLYERWLPYHSGEDLIDYFTTGGGGAPNHDSYNLWHSQDRVFWEDVDRNFCKVEVTSSSCKVYAYRVDCVSGKREYELIDEKELHQTSNNDNWVLSAGETWSFAAEGSGETYTLTHSYGYGESEWTDYEFDEAGDPNWDPVNWAGEAPIGYSNPGPPPEDPFLVTRLNQPPVERKITYYFRLHGAVTPTADVLNAVVYHKIDDGCVVYFSEQGKDYGSTYGLYSIEGERFNVPRNVVMGHGAKATYAVSGTSLENKWRGMTIPDAGDKLKANQDYLIAVEVHQVSDSSSDICLDVKIVLEYDQQ